MKHSKPKREFVETIPKTASYVENDNPNANNFVWFEQPEKIVWFTVTGNDAMEPNKIIKETFVQVHN